MTDSKGFTTGSVQARATASQQAEIEKQFTLDEVDPIGRTEAMIVGPPGSGKTVLAGTFPGPFRWLAADGETCIKSLRWAFKAGHMSITDMKQVVAYTPTEVEGIYPDKPNAFNLASDMIDYWFSPADVSKWENGTLVIDSLSEINEWAMNVGLDLNSQFPSPNKPLSGSHAINKKAHLRIVTGQQDYKSAMALTQGFINDIRAACAKHNRNLVILCHEWPEHEGKGDDERLVAIKPFLHGKLRDHLPKSFDDVWFMSNYIKGSSTEYKVQLQADHLRKAKTRWGSIMAREEEADYRTLIQKVRAYHGL